MTDNQATLIVVTAAAAFLMLLPIIITSSNSRKPLEVAAFLLCALSAAAFIFGLFVGASASVLSFFISLPVAAGLWFAALFCALTAWADAAHERRAKEMTLRLLTNDASELGHLKKGRSRWL